MVKTALVGGCQLSSKSQGHLPERQILIADDRELMRSALKAIFALRSHWQVCGEATDGAEAVAMASQLRPDLIILDFKCRSARVSEQQAKF
jgi:DNA-binding NarL/FixJ family response regulator